jgi:Fur family peroxide stress response transcriptional regulator
MRNDSPALRQRRFDDLRSAVRTAGVKMTPQRLEILRELAASEEHPDAETVFRAVRTNLPTVSLDTVYRTLWMLHDLGLVTTLGARRGGVRFDANRERHHHYVCVRCGLVRDFESHELDGLDVPRQVTRLGSVGDVQVEVRGLCTRCLQSRKRQQSRKPSRSSRAGRATRKRSRS